MFIYFFYICRYTKFIILFSNRMKFFSFCYRTI
nr:MAG TPA: hypothetical protein [Crassvirales sp.]